METVAISAEREERRRQQKERADRLKASGAMEEIFAEVDAGQPLTGGQGLIGGMLKAALERGLETELTEHIGYERGDAEVSLYPNSRNGTKPQDGVDRDRRYRDRDPWAWKIADSDGAACNGRQHSRVS